MARQTLREILLHVVECQPPHLALAVLDSAVHSGRASAGFVRSAVSETRRGAVLASCLDPGAGAGGESILRWHLRAAGIGFRTQVLIEGLYRSDFLIGRRLIVEVDGREHHGMLAGFERDRRLDRELQLRGYVILRFTYRELLDDPGRVIATILAVVRSDRHRRALVG